MSISINNQSFYEKPADENDVTHFGHDCPNIDRNEHMSIVSAAMNGKRNNRLETLPECFIKENFGASEVIRSDAFL